MAKNLLCQALVLQPSHHLVPLKSDHFSGENRRITILNFFHHLATELTEIWDCANHSLFKWDTSFFESFLSLKTTPPCGFQDAPISNLKIAYAFQFLCSHEPVAKRERTGQHQKNLPSSESPPPCKRRPDPYVNRIFKQAWWQKHSIWSINGRSGNFSFSKLCAK